MWPPLMRGENREARAHKRAHGTAREQAIQRREDQIQQAHIHREAIRAETEARYPVVPQNAHPGGWLRGNSLQRREAELAQQELRTFWRYQHGLQNEVNRGTLANEEGLARMVELPILRETAVEMKECPICFVEMGETGKTVLKCGHTVCESCFLQQVLRAMSLNSTSGCACPVCRVNYIK